MKNRSYRFLWLAAFGALLGVALATWLGPRAIVWYWNPPVNMGLLNCTAPIEWSLHRLVITQLVGALVGAALGIGAFFMFRRHHPAELPPL